MEAGPARTAEQRAGQPMLVCFGRIVALSRCVLLLMTYSKSAGLADCTPIGPTFLLTCPAIRRTLLTEFERKL